MKKELLLILFGAYAFIFVYLLNIYLFQSMYWQVAPFTTVLSLYGFWKFMLYIGKVFKKSNNNNNN